MGAGGAVVAQGSYEELVKRGIDFDDYRNVAAQEDSVEDEVAALRRQSIVHRKSMASNGRKQSVVSLYVICYL